MYHADLVAQNPSDPVFVTEGEKDADTIYNYDGSLSTTIPNGAGVFTVKLDCYSDGLRNREVIILTDNAVMLGRLTERKLLVMRSTLQSLSK